MSESEQKTPAELRKAAADLLAEAERLQSEERARQVNEVKALIVQYGLDKEELFPEKRTRGGKGAVKGFKTEAYYINPKTGENARKRGPKPNWLKELIASGAPESSYIIERGATYTPGAEPAPAAPAKAPAKMAAPKAAAKPAAKAPAKKAAAKKAK